MAVASSAIHVRPARSIDYAAFARLFRELAVDDPIPDEHRFVEVLAPTTLIAEHEGEVLGYAYFQRMTETAYVRNVVSAPTARRRGVGRTLMNAVADAARAGGCSTWCLNVRPDNTAAIALYERVGLRRAYASRSLRVAWARLPEIASRRARRIEPDDDARVESAMRLIAGQLATARAMGRVLFLIEDVREILGAASFDPHFPGAYPFRVARPELASELLDELRPFALAAYDFVSVLVEGQPEVADALVAKGAEVRLELVHMTGALGVGRL